jgi:hypothetical protein
MGSRFERRQLIALSSMLKGFTKPINHNVGLEAQNVFRGSVLISSAEAASSAIRRPVPRRLLCYEGRHHETQIEHVRKMTISFLTAAVARSF